MTKAQRRGILAGCLLAGLLVVGAVIGAVMHEPHGRPVPVSPTPVQWEARILLFLAVSWLAIGMLAARTSLVGRPGAAAARATWLGSSRPWRARESTLGLLPLDRWLIFLVPTALLVATRWLQTSLQGWVHLVVVLATWVAFTVVLRAAVGRRSPWPVLAAVGGVVVLRCIVTLVALSIAEAEGFSAEFWANGVLRSAFVAVSFALFIWAFVAGAWVLHVQGGIRYSAGAMLAALGTGIAVPALGIALAGAERVVGVWDDGLGVLPHSLLPVGGASLGMLAWISAAVGLVTVAVGAVLLRSARAAR